MQAFYVCFMKFCMALNSYIYFHVFIKDLQALLLRQNCPAGIFRNKAV